MADFLFMITPRHAAGLEAALWLSYDRLVIDDLSKLSRIVQPGRVTGVLTLALALIALAGCGGVRTLQPFETDGCSMFPDGTLAERDLWFDCCYQHDIAYWRGGTRNQREAADHELAECVEDVRNPVLAGTMYSGVRAGGAAWWPSAFRWGYGWPYGRGYQSLSDAERQNAERLLQESQLQGLESDEN